jgi:hypothetical protein
MLKTRVEGLTLEIEVKINHDTTNIQNDKQNARNLHEQLFILRFENPISN